MIESKKFKHDSDDYDNDYENQLFPGYNDDELKPTRIRWLILLLSFFGVMCAYVTRLNLSLTIVAMVKSVNTSIIANTSINYDDQTYHAPKFNWDAKTQGLILGSFFYTYGLLQVVGARYSEQFGSKLISLVIIFSSGLISFIIPFAARIGVIPMIFSRALLGIAQSSVYPVYYCLISKWFPEHEQSRALALLSNGAYVGTIVTMETAGYLCESDWFGGYPSVFYLSGTICIVWCVFWTWLAASEPRLHSFVNKQEMLYIERDKSSISLQHQNATPWKEILTSKAVWSVIIVKFGVDYVFWLIMLNLPQYLHNVLRLKMHQNGLVNCALNLMLIFSGTIAGFLSDKFVNKKVMDKTKLRKTFQTFAIVGTNICLLLVTLCQEFSTRSVIIILIITMFFYGFNIGGDIPIVIDMTEDFPATIFAIANGVCSLTGFITPTLTGYIIDQNVGDFNAWSTVFRLAAFINTIGLIVFLVFGDASPLFKENKKNKSQAFDLDMMAGETERDSLILTKKKRLFDDDNFNNNYSNGHTKFNGLNPAFVKDDDDN